jgi:hypothetical protein
VLSLLTLGVLAYLSAYALSLSVWNRISATDTQVGSP